MLTDVLCIPSNFYLWRPAAVSEVFCLVEIMYDSLRKQSGENDDYQWIIQDTVFWDQIFDITMPSIWPRKSEYIRHCCRENLNGFHEHSSHEDLSWLYFRNVTSSVTDTNIINTTFLWSPPGWEALGNYWTTEPGWLGFVFRLMLLKLWSVDEC